MLNLQTVTSTFILTQEPAATGIPTWVWVLLGIILVIVVLGLIIGARTSEPETPPTRSTSMGDEMDTTRNQQPVRPEMIPQTGNEVLSGMSPVEETVEDVEGPFTHDDLTIIHGLSIAASQLLIDAGITTFSLLAQSDRRTLESILGRSGLEYSQLETWPEQASLAEVGRFEELEAYRI